MAGLKQFFSERADIVWMDGPHPATQDDPEVAKFFEPPFFEWYNASQVGEGAVGWGGNASQVGEGAVGWGGNASQVGEGAVGWGGNAAQVGEGAVGWGGGNASQVF